MKKIDPYLGHKYYLRNDLVKIEEDQTHEFKGHRNVSVDEVPPWCINTPDNNRTRNAISRNLCGFLNSGLGGTVYVGILDGGRVEGVRLTQYQQDHLLLSLQTAMKAFRPPVPHFMYNVDFVPVLDPFDSYPVQFPPTPEDVRGQPHYLNSYLFCWCDYDSLGSYNNGIIPMAYVVEITIPPVDISDKRIYDLIPYFKVPTLPIFQCEDGQVYFRKHSTLVKYSFRDVEEHVVEDKLLYKMPSLMQAWKQCMIYNRLRELVTEAEEKQSKTASNCQ